MIEEVKKILEKFRRLDDIDNTSYQAGINQERNLNNTAKEICQLLKVKLPPNPYFHAWHGHYTFPCKACAIEDYIQQVKELNEWEEK